MACANPTTFNSLASASLRMGGGGGEEVAVFLSGKRSDG